MAYQMAATAVTLNDLEGNLQVAGLLKCNRSNILQHFARFQLTVCSPSLCLSKVSCIYRETTDKRIVYARVTESR